MSQTFKLYRLQQIDSQLDSDRQRVEEIDHKLRDNEALKTAELRANTALNSLEKVQKALKKAEQEVQAQLVKMEQLSQIPQKS